MLPHTIRIRKIRTWRFAPLEREMSGTTAPRIDVHVGEVRESQLVIGDYTTVKTAKGTKVTIVQVGDRPVPHLRKLPISERPSPGVDVVGRAAELALAASASAEQTDGGQRAVGDG